MARRIRINGARQTRVALLLCAVLTMGPAAAAPTLESVAVTPASGAISVGQTQLFKATGTFSDGSAHGLGPAIANIAPGFYNTCILLARGGVKCWGDNTYGQLGESRTVAVLVPRRIKGITNATTIAFGEYEMPHGCAVLTGGTVKCWGDGSYGQLGNGTRNSSAVAVAVTGINSATAVTVGALHSCALLADGAVRCWGLNYGGLLGDGTDARYSTVPVAVAGISTAIAVAAQGEGHTCAVLASGAVQCWGTNYDGELGNGTRTDSNTPVTVVGISDATAVALGQYFSCALLKSGAVECWGEGYGGQLGDGNSHQSSIPVSVALTGAAVAITAGGGHACAVMSTGTVQCWGANYFGQLGNGLTTAWSSSTPVQVNGISVPVRLEAGWWHTCALLSDGAMRCWGNNFWGQLGNQRRAEWPIRWPVNVIGTPGVLWQSSDPSKATISEGGRATGRTVGNTTITATTAGFVNDNAVLTVR